MITPAIPEGEADPAWFFIDFRGIPWDGSAGVLLRSEWDGHGMSATDSHAFAFRNVPATRFAWPGYWRDLLGGGAGVGSMLFTAVIVGVADVAMNYIRQRLQQRGQQALRSFDRVELVMAEREAWLIVQAYEGGLQSFEKHGRGPLDAAMAKATVATLAESLLTRLCRLSGGGAYSRSSPLGYWANDVRALGFLRPPWALANDSLFDLTWQRAMAPAAK
jgi:alkylation response protein AidB-like acyl-CoA dehydrogenase